MTRESLQSMIATIEDCIHAVSCARLNETAVLLEIAKLDLVARMNGISEQELELCSEALLHRATAK